MSFIQQSFSFKSSSVEIIDCGCWKNNITRCLNVLLSDMKVILCLLWLLEWEKLGKMSLRALFEWWFNSLYLYCWKLFWFSVIIRVNLSGERGKMRLNFIRCPLSISKNFTNGIWYSSRNLYEHFLILKFVLFLVKNFF